MTRSHIALLMPDGTVRHVYCHSEGYPTDQGAVIQQHWNDPREVADLIELGDLASLGADLNDTSAYARDLGYDRNRDCSPQTAQGIEEILSASMENIFIEYLYLHTPAGWLCADTVQPGATPLLPLGEAIELYRKNYPRPAPPVPERRAQKWRSTGAAS